MEKLVGVTEKLVIDRMTQEDLEYFRRHGVSVKTFPRGSEDELISELKDVDGLIVGMTVIGRRFMENAVKLKVIGRFGIGVDNIDLDAATERGVIVFNVPRIFTESVAEFTLALILSLSRRVVEADRCMRKGEWYARAIQLLGIDVAGKTLGLIGFGNIARALARKCGGLGVRILAYDPYVSAEVFEEAGVERTVSLDELLKQSDIVSLHTPLTSETRRMIGRRELSIMKKDAYLVNTSRGPVLDEEALIEALRKGTISGAALDVFEKEPPDFTSPLFKMTNIIVAPHIASSTWEASRRVFKAVAENVCRVLEGGVPSGEANVVNKAVIERWG